MTAGLSEGHFIRIRGLLDPLFLTLVFAGPVFGFPKIKNMFLMAASSILGAAAGYGIYSSGQNINDAKAFRSPGVVRNINFAPESLK